MAIWITAMVMCPVFITVAKVMEHQNSGRR